MDELFELEQELNETNEEEEIIQTDNPFFSIPTKPFIKFLQVATKFAWRTGRDLTSKSVTLTLDDNKENVICRATDFDNYFSLSIPVLKTSNQSLKEPLILNTQNLIKFIRLCKNSITFMRGLDGSNPHILVCGQWVQVEPIETESSIYINNDIIGDKYNTTLPVLANLISVVSSGTNPKDRVINFTNKGIYLSHFWSMINVEYESPIDFTLTEREASILRFMTNGDKDRDITIFKTNSDLARIGFMTPTATFLIIHRTPENVKDIKFDTKFSIEVETSLLNKIVKISEDIPTSSNKLGFKYNNGFSIIVKSTLSSISYPIPVLKHGVIPELETSIIQTSTVANLLKPITEDVVNITWNENKLYISSPSVKISLEIER